MLSFRPLRLAAVAALGIAFAATTAAAEPLKLQVYNPGKSAMFPVSSEIISGATEVVLIDAQFQRNDAQALVEQIKATGKKLTTVYISYRDPDYYFGLDVVHAAFPDARIVATPQTVAAILATKDGKLAHWGPVMKDNAPQALVVPEAMDGLSLTVDGHKLEIVGPNPARRVVWIPSLEAVVGGVPVAANVHVWVADTQTLAERRDWLETLDAIAALKPKVVIPGHYLPNADGTAPHGVSGVNFTRLYLQAFDQEAARAKDSTALVDAMKRRYPGLDGSSSLELGAKVVKGEVKWPQ